MGYAGLTIGSSAAVVLATALFPGDDPDTIHQGFYAAAAQIIPVLMLAFIVRIATMRDAVIEDHRRVEKRWTEMLDRISTQRAKFEAEGVEPETLKRVIQLEEEVKAEQGGPKSTAPYAELIAGTFVSALVMGVLGICAALTALAKESDTGPLFAATLLSLWWVVIGLAAHEALYYFSSDSLRAE